MECVVCGQRAVFDQPSLCEKHFLDHVEKTVATTINNHSLCTKDDQVCVAASGGKDSLILLAILHQLGYNVEALAIDEGISGYREHSLKDLQSFCDKENIPLKVVSFKESFGKPLDALVNEKRPCTVCGVFRRTLLNKHAKGYDVIATGHNLDDEAQATLMNLVKGNHDLLHRSYVRTPLAPGFVPRIKPLIFLTERETTAYAFIKGLTKSYVECPYAPLSFRAHVRDILNTYESAHHGMKRCLVDASLRSGITGQKRSLSCPLCGEPSAGGACRACRLQEELTGDAS